MKKVKILGITTLLLIAGVFVISLTIDGFVKSSIEQNASELMQTDVSISDVDISLFNGKGSISGLKVENPEGFSEEHAISIDKTSFTLDFWSIFSDQIIISDLLVEKPELFFEQKGLGINLKVLNDNLDANSTSSDQMMIIDHLLIEDGVVKVSTSVDRERMAEASFNSIEMNGIGRDGNSSVKQGMKQILQPLLKQALAEAIKGGVIDQIESKIKGLIDG